MRFSTVFVPALLGLEAAALRAGPSTVGNLNKRVEEVRARRSSHVKRDVDPTTLYTAHNFSVPVDFFLNETRYEPHVNSTFNIRYWYDNTYYKPGGPVFVLLSGETSGEDRLPYLQKGIAHQVVEATGGLAVILEHRYYGTSFPVPNVTTENLRFLSTEQALADVDYFARNVKLEGIDADLTAPKTPWIAYGGSYAGAQAAFLRVAYPDTFWGTISSSGVTEAIYDYWEYFEPIRLFAPPDCIHNTQTFIDVLDNILQKSNSTSKTKELKDAFGLGDITDNRDFANIFTAVYGWQSTNWDPAVNSPAFYYYCGNISATLNFPELESKRSTVQDLISAAGYDKSTQVENIMLNAIGYYGETSVAAWNSSGISQDAYFTTLNATYWQQTDLDAANAWRSWYYQVCTEYGFIQTGNTPANIKPIISRLLDVDYGTFFCRAGYNITTPPDLDRVNKYGGFDIAYDRLAIIGGNADPWRPATPLHNGDATRNSTTERPWLEIAHAVHHWEENGLFPNETTPILPPNQIVYAQQFIADFVVDWIKEFNSKEHSEL